MLRVVCTNPVLYSTAKIVVLDLDKFVTIEGYHLFECPELKSNNFLFTKSS